MFELKISADGAEDLISNIRNLAAAMGASVSPVAIEAATEQKLKRTRKTAEPEQTDSAAQNVAKSDTAESTTGTVEAEQPEQPADEPVKEPEPETKAEPEVKKADDEVAGPDDISDYESVKDWIISKYLMEVYASQAERAAAFKDLVTPFGTSSLKSLPADKWPDVVAVVKKKIKAAGK